MARFAVMVQGIDDVNDSMVLMALISRLKGSQDATSLVWCLVKMHAKAIVRAQEEMRVEDTLIGNI